MKNLIEYLNSIKYYIKLGKTIDDAMNKCRKRKESICMSIGPDVPKYNNEDEVIIVNIDIDVKPTIFRRNPENNKLQEIQIGYISGKEYFGNRILTPINKNKYKITFINNKD